MSATDAVDAGAVAEASTLAGPVTLEILETVRTAQIQNGLRHSDYSRYRQYCARRLRRLRTGKGVSWTHGKGKKFVQREMQPDDVKESRHLAIILFNAERAWADAQEVKQAAGAGENIGAVARSHMMGRFKKAAGWAIQLEKLCRVRADGRTSLEAEAYACYMSGLLASEEAQHAEDAEMWGEALLQFANARKIYENLSTVAPKRAKQLYSERIVDIQPLERFCKYNMTKAGRQPPTVVPEPPGLQARIADALASTLAARFDGVNTVYWKGSIVPVRSDRVRAALGEARTALAREVPANASAGPVAAAAAAASEHSARWFDEGAKAASNEAAAAAREGKDALAADCKALHDYCRFMKARSALGQATAAAVAAGQDAEASGPGAAARSDGAAPASARGKGKGGKGSRADGAEAQSSGSGAAGAAAPDVYGASIYHSAVGKVGAPDGSAAGKGKRGPSSSNAAALSAVSAFNRSLTSLDDMAVLLGGPLAPHSASPEGATTETGSPIAPGSGHANDGILSELAIIPADADAEGLQCLFARQACILAWRCWYAALVHLGAQRYADAASLLHRAKARAQAAIRAYASLAHVAASASAGGSKGGSLPDKHVAPGSAEAEDPAVPLVFVLTGVCKADVYGLQSLLTLCEARGVAIDSFGLIERLGSEVRTDAPLAGLYKAAMAAKGMVQPGAAPALAPLTRSSSRPAWLTSRAGEASLAEATDSPSAIGPLPPALLPVPAKPFLFDLAFNGIQYPAAVQEAADAIAAQAEAKKGSSGAAVGAGAAGEASGGAGLLSWLTGR